MLNPGDDGPAHVAAHAVVGDSQIRVSTERHEANFFFLPLSFSLAARGNRMASSLSSAGRRLVGNLSLRPGVASIILGLPDDVAAVILYLLTFPDQSRLWATFCVWRLLFSAAMLLPLHRSLRLPRRHLLCFFPTVPPPSPGGPSRRSRARHSTMASPTSPRSRSAAKSTSSAAPALTPGAIPSTTPRPPSNGSTSTSLATTGSASPTCESHEGASLAPPRPGVESSWMRRRAARLSTWRAVAIPSLHPPF
ncbi:hypothetical protein OsJ_09769 [Oryza sativa Japonica Group]|uniref:Uncharacterized protein n=1 Tax=Oryza sativa subsp. japonica TaxID=39947 RepID=B9F5P7_ORYSJ|nr:hypothetical protein OsJ_09769 [Oryza sativa Japonica Group]